MYYLNCIKILFVLKYPKTLIGELQTIDRLFPKYYFKGIVNYIFNYACMHLFLYNNS